MHQYRRAKSGFRNLITLSSTTKLLGGFEPWGWIRRHPDWWTSLWRRLYFGPFWANGGSVFENVLLILLFEFRFRVVLRVVLVISKVKIQVVVVLLAFLGRAKKVRIVRKIKVRLVLRRLIIHVKFFWIFFIVHLITQVQIFIVFIIRLWFSYWLPFGRWGLSWRSSLPFSRWFFVSKCSFR